MLCYSKTRKRDTVMEKIDDYTMNQEFDIFKNMCNENIPDNITEEWLRENLNNPNFSRWGFTYSDLSNCTFGKINPETLQNISYSTYTKFPVEHPFNTDFSKQIDYSIKDIHNNGITGKGVNVAIIDEDFLLRHVECDSIIDYTDCREEKKSNDDYHGLIVSSMLAGKNVGVAPEANISYFAASSGSIEGMARESIAALKNIYNRNLEGANIKVVSISGYAHRENPEFNMIRQLLAEQGCSIIDSVNFGMAFTCINAENKDNTTSYYYSKWQEEDKESYKSLIAVPVPKLIPLSYTTNGYRIGGNSSYSWAIPRLSGIYALCLQINPELTIEQCAQLAQETKIVTEDGISIINPKGMIEKLSLDLEENRTR